MTKKYTAPEEKKKKKKKKGSGDSRQNGQKEQKKCPKMVGRKQNTKGSKKTEISQKCRKTKKRKRIQ